MPLRGSQPVLLTVLEITAARKRETTKAVFLVQVVLAVGYNQPNTGPLTMRSGVSMQSYRLRAAIPAILHKRGGDQISVTLPHGAVLADSSEASSILLGMTGVSWEGRHYSVYLIDLLQKAERVFTA